MITRLEPPNHDKQVKSMLNSRSIPKPCSQRNENPATELQSRDFLVLAVLVLGAALGSVQDSTMNRRVGVNLNVTHQAASAHSTERGF